ncbi:N-6 DNA methylase [Clostridium sp. SYSU_GA19001]|uniref:Eco57I restriction-modification methylase domain-containing protein n=1 Tax=Clostridium caldaquaticum TaxID=2940653 RepID=UPI0020775B5C|nr:TaqI-like C-terminal specificity domain-containing protein [Clostridium caldaquaticum]MCM8711293.1 N-6 DNA methylase [Clostridium caldaquaticum]
MVEIFMENIGKLYDIILQPIDIMYKLTAINNYKTKLNVGKNESFGEFYFNMVQNKKNNGVIYTPIEIANYIVENTIKDENIIQNPFIRIADPSCGCGNLIIPCFLHLKNIYKNNLEKINKLHNINLKEEDIEKHIIENNLFGFDIDESAVKILLIDLFNISKYIKVQNFFNADFLLDEGIEKFDVFIGNPPYIGHKTIDKNYSTVIKLKYRQIFKDKGDLSYCFFKAALNKLNKGGKLTFITSRYFLESLSGEELRKTLKEFCSIDRIIDFYGIRPFKNVGIDPVIIFLTLDRKSDIIQVIKPNVSKNKYFYSAVFEKIGQDFNLFAINKANLNDKGWILRDEKERNIINKIEKKCFTSLGNICDSFQGIITGCDKAFVVDRNTIIQECLEQDIIKPWIKSSYIHKEKVQRADSYIIYSDLISDEYKYPKCMEHIARFKEKLVQRRECKNGIRKWYMLQWGRNKNIFEGEKIVFPFKSNKSRFSLDKGSYFSADVYCLILKEHIPFSYEYLLKILNSKVYEYYFKTFAKKLGEDLYEYYPNNLMKLCIPNITDLNGDVDVFLYDFFQLEDSEIETMKKYVEH